MSGKIVQFPGSNFVPRKERLKNAMQSIVSKDSAAIPVPADLAGIEGILPIRRARIPLLVGIAPNNSMDADREPACKADNVNTITHSTPSITHE